MNPSQQGLFARSIDRLVESVSPQAGLRRKIARSKLHAFRYDGAQPSRERHSNPQTLQSPESSGYSRDRVQLLKEARDLAENGELATAILGKFERHVCGTIAYQSTTGDDRIDGAYEEYFGDWCKVADFTGRHSLRLLACLALREAMTSGDAGIAIMREDDNLSLSCIEGDRIGNPTQARQSEGEVSGVILDEWKRPVAYRVYERTLSGAYVNPRDNPAHSFIHFFKPKRFDEYRGVSSFHAVVNSCIDIKDIIRFEKLAVKWASAQAGVVSGGQAGPDPNNFFEPGTTQPGSGAALRLEEISPGRINYLGTDGEFTQFKIDRPGAAWQGFLQLLIKLYAIGMDIPYGFLFEMAGLTGPAARFESQQAKRTFQHWQELLKEKVLDRVKNLVIANGIAFHGLPSHQRWMRGTWQWPAHPTIDTGRESQANVNENRQGLKSMDTILAGENIDGRTEREKIAQERAHWYELAAQHNVPVSVLLPADAGVAASGEAEDDADPDDDKDEDRDDADSIESLRAAIDAYGVGVRAGTFTPTQEDENHFRAKLGLPKITSDVQRAWREDGGVRRPITLTPPGDQQAPARAPGDDPEDADDAAPPARNGKRNGNIFRFRA